MTAAIKRNGFSVATKILLIALLLTCIVLPLILILISAGTIDIGQVVGSSMFSQAVLNSFATTVTATAISMAFAFLLSYSISCSNIRFKGIFAILFSIPMLIPSISHGMGILVLFGENGLFTRFLPGGGISGFWGIVLGSVQYSFPVAFLMFTDIFRYEDKSVYDAADVMGVPKHRQFINITLPYLFKPLISIFFATFTMIFTDYGVAMMIGGRTMTLPLFMYQEVIGRLNFGVGAIVAVVLILPALAAFIFDSLKKENGSSDFSHRQTELKINKKLDISVYILCAVSAVIVLLPVITFVFMGFFAKYPTDLTMGLQNVIKAMEAGAGRYLFNSLGISVIVAEIGTVSTYFLAYMTARVPSKFNRYLHLLSMLSLAIPGVVLGIGYSLLFGGSFLSGTIAVLILVNIVHFFSSPYLMCYNAFNKINRGYEAVAATLNISKFRFFKDIMIRQTYDTVLEAFSYFFVNSMVTISAVSFLATYHNKPLALMINSFEALMLLECAAFVSFLILVVNSLMKLGIYLIKRGLQKSKAKEELC